MDKMIGFIGAGNMGGALASAVSRSVGGNSVTLYDTDKEKASALAKQLRCLTADSLSSLVTASDVLFIGVKPQVIEKLFEALLPLLSKKAEKPLLISMAAGVPIERLTALSGGKCRIIRMMPNTPVAVGAGMIQYAGCADVTEEDKNLFRILLCKAGELDESPEDKIDAACALSGSGPAFCAIMAEAMADAGVTCGLPREKAILYAAQTMRGTADLILSGIHPAVLKDMVSSPGGTTVAGIMDMEKHGFRAAAEAAVTAAYRRALEMKSGK